MQDRKEIKPLTNHTAAKKFLTVKPYPSSFHGLLKISLSKNKRNRHERLESIFTMNRYVLTLIDGGPVEPQKLQLRDEELQWEKTIRLPTTFRRPVDRIIPLSNSLFIYHHNPFYKNRSGLYNEAVVYEIPSLKIICRISPLKTHIEPVRSSILLSNNYLMGFDNKINKIWCTQINTPISSLKLYPALDVGEANHFTKIGTDLFVYSLKEYKKPNTYQFQLVLAQWQEHSIHTKGCAIIKDKILQTIIPWQTDKIIVISNAINQYEKNFITILSTNTLRCLNNIVINNLFITDNAALLPDNETLVFLCNSWISADYEKRKCIYLLNLNTKKLQYYKLQKIVVDFTIKVYNDFFYIYAIHDDGDLCSIFLKRNIISHTLNKLGLFDSIPKTIIKEYIDVDISTDNIASRKPY